VARSAGRLVPASSGILTALWPVIMMPP
jgi:hypothetical protein